MHILRIILFYVTVDQNNNATQNQKKSLDMINVYKIKINYSKIDCLYPALNLKEV